MPPGLLNRLAPGLLGRERRNLLILEWRARDGLIYRWLRLKRRLPPGIGRLLIALRGSGGCMFGARTAIVANVAPDVEDRQQNHDHHNHHIEIMQRSADLAIVIAQFVANKSEEQAPGQRPQEGIEAKLAEIH